MPQAKLSKLIRLMQKIASEEDFKAQKLQEWGFKKNEYTLGQDKVDIKLDSIWIEAKQKDEDVYRMLSQIIFTAYRARLKSVDLPIAFGCFNSKKGALIDNHLVQDVFAHTDINWAQAPSMLDKDTVEKIKFLLKEVREYSLDSFGKAIKEINCLGQLTKKQITKNNFINIYNEWLLKIGNNLDEKVRPDCYLADLMTSGSKTIAEKLKIVLEGRDQDRYYEKKESDELYRKITIKNQQDYANFWAKYDRPPKEEYQDYILSRRDLLQPDHIREVKGAFFTPKIWSAKSKDYLAKAFGENWQDEYYIWDCACGTGNLEAGLVNQERVFMSTLDDADLAIMAERGIAPNAMHFQFDFLNDDWKPQSKNGKIPDPLWEIMAKAPQKLIVYINPPYLEVTNAKTSSGGGKNRGGGNNNFAKSKNGGVRPWQREQ